MSLTGLGPLREPREPVPEAMFSSGMDFFYSLVAGAFVLAVVLAAVMHVRANSTASHLIR